MKKINIKSQNKILFIITSLLLIILDQISKLSIPKGYTNKLTSFLSFTYIENYGAGFGIMQGKTFFLIIISIIAILIISYYYKEIIKNKTLSLGSGLILAGTIGNLIDRIVYGYVIDFISFSFWPAFNIADVSLTIGGLLLAIWIITEEAKETSKNKRNQKTKSSQII